MTQKKKLIIFSIFLLCLVGGFTCMTTITASAKVTCSFKKGTLTIKGKGKMPASMKLPKKKKIKKIVIRPGVTSIPEYAFFQLPKVQEITVANTVKSIGNEAFVDCFHLKKISIPGKFKQTGLKKGWKLMDKAVNTIVFRSPVDLKIAASLPTKAYVVSGNDPKYKSTKGSIYTKDGKSLVCIPSHVEEITTAPGCTNFNTGAPCDDTKITLGPDIRTVTFGKNDSSIDGAKPEHSSFTILSNWLTADALYRLLQSFPQAAMRTNEKNSKSTYDPAAFPSTVKKEGDCYVMNDILFYYDGKETSFTVPRGIRKIASRAFWNKEELKTVYIPEGVNEIGVESFYECNELEEVHLPESLTNLGARAFAGTYGLTKVNIPSGLKTIPESAFQNGHIDRLVIPDNVEEIGVSAFASNNIMSLSLGKNVRRIDSFAFEFNGLRTLTLPKKLTYIGKQAFWMNELKKVTIEGNPKHYSMDAFYASNYIYKRGIRNAVTTITKWKVTKYLKPDKMLVRMKWGKISGVSGYEIKISADSKMKKHVSEKVISKNSTSTNLSVKNKNGESNMYCMVRPFQKKNGKTYYGRWSKEELDSTLF